MRPRWMDGREFYGHQRYGDMTPATVRAVGNVLLALFAGILAGAISGFLTLVINNH